MMMNPSESMMAPVLVVDDHDDARETLAMVLEAEGYPVATACDGADAWRYLHRCPPPCLILLDLTMPVMDGWEFRRRQRADSKLTRIPVVIISAVADVNPMGPPLEADDFLPKPVDVDQLLTHIRRHCRPTEA
jgi:CheY-like chemotaxis protein